MRLINSLAEHLTRNAWSKVWLFVSWFKCPATGSRISKLGDKGTPVSMQPNTTHAESYRSRLDNEEARELRVTQNWKSFKALKRQYRGSAVSHRSEMYVFEQNRHQTRRRVLLALGRQAMVVRPKRENGGNVRMFQKTRQDNVQLHFLRTQSEQQSVPYSIW